MAFEMIVALLVTDAQVYQEYREEMRPLLEAAGGGFRYDFEIARTVKGEATHGINRVFAIYFRDRAAKDAFFSDPQYRAIRARLYDESIRASTIIAEYER